MNVDISSVQQHISRGEFVQAEQLLPKYVDIPTKNAHLYYLFALAVSNQGRLKEALVALQDVIRLEPDRSAGYLGLARIYKSLERFPEAIQNYRRTCECQTDAFDAWIEMIEVLELNGQRPDAFQACRDLLEKNPEYGRGYYTLAVLSQQSEHHDDAIKAFEKALECTPDLFEAHLGLGQCFGAKGDREQARWHFERLLDAQPEHLGALGGLATLHEREGQLDDAFTIVRRVVDAGKSHDTIANIFLRICKRFDRCDEAIEYASAVLESPEIEGNTSGQQDLHFSLGKCYDKRGNYDQAFFEYDLANRILEARYDPAAHTDAVTRIIDIFTPGFMMSAARATNFSSRPVFIVGMPRSGTSLTEQVLSSHSQVAPAGELEDISAILTELPKYSATNAGYPECVRELSATGLDAIATPYHHHLSEISADAQYVTDKMPHNFLALGLIALLFPGARIVHCRRDALDTCLSIYFQEFLRVHDYASSLEGVGTHFRQYQRLMKHWKNVIGIPMFELDYEDMITDQESTTRRLLEFCNLEWDPQCLNFHKSKRVVHTASYAQVNKPIYTQSMQRWKHYDKHLDGLKAALERDY